MEIVELPIIVYALIEGVWSRVIGVSPHNAWVAVITERGNQVFPPAEAQRWDLLWP